MLNRMRELESQEKIEEVGSKLRKTHDLDKNSKQK